MAESLGNRLAQDRGPKSDGRRTDMNSPSIVKSVPVGLLVSPVSGRLPNTRSDSRLPFALLIRITRPETLPTQTSSSSTSRRFDARLSVTSRAQREYPYVSKARISEGAPTMIIPLQWRIRPGGKLSFFPGALTVHRVTPSLSSARTWSPGRAREDSIRMRSARKSSGPAETCSGGLGASPSR